MCMCVCGEGGGHAGNMLKGDVTSQIIYREIINGTVCVTAAFKRDSLLLLYFYFL